MSHSLQPNWCSSIFSSSISSSISSSSSYSLLLPPPPSPSPPLRQLKYWGSMALTRIPDKTQVTRNHPLLTSPPHPNPGISPPHSLLLLKIFSPSSSPHPPSLLLLLPSSCTGMFCSPLGHQTVYCCRRRSKEEEEGKEGKEGKQEEEVDREF